MIELAVARHVSASTEIATSHLFCNSDQSFDFSHNEDITAKPRCANRY